MTNASKRSLRSVINNNSSKSKSKMGSSSTSSYHYHRSVVVIYMTLLLPFCVISSSYSSSRSLAFLPTIATTPSRKRSISSSSSLSVSSTTPYLDEDNNNKQSKKRSNNEVPTVEFIDPQTGCEVVLLGCFHGTESSSQDVQHVITPETDVVVLELCQKRFDDLQSWMEEEKQEAAAAAAATTTTSDDESHLNNSKKPWMVAYMSMIHKTIQERGLSTGLAAAVLGGFSGMQTALSGFSPGLEFKTALECAQQHNAEIVLADRDVDETLKQIGNIPRISFDMFFHQNESKEEEEEEEENQYQLHATTLQRAVFGPSSSSSSNFHPVQLGQVLMRSTAAVQDLIRLTIPPTFLYFCFIQMILAISPTTSLTIPTATGGDEFAAVDFVAATTSTVSASSAEEMIVHWLASFCILSFGYFGIALPSVRVILTERDQCLADGIQQACHRAGKNGRVVAVLGLLHLNGVATRMMNNNDGDDHAPAFVNLNNENNQQE